MDGVARDARVVTRGEPGGAFLLASLLVLCALLIILFGVVRRADALIQANRGSEPALQFGMSVDIIPSQRLLNHHQIEFVERFEQLNVSQRVS